jgi:hypothetical protein
MAGNVNSSPIHCDFCGCTSDILRHDSVPDRFGHYNFCRAGTCYKNYKDFVYNNNTKAGIPFSVQKNPKRKDDDDDEHVDLLCDFCGSTENVIHHSCVPDRFGHYNFCKYTACYDNYHLFIYCKDLSAGIPYSIKITYPAADKPIKNKQCVYCGNKSGGVIKYYSPYTKFKFFCKNNRCYKNFCEYVISRPPPQPFVDPSGIPSDSSDD